MKINSPAFDNNGSIPKRHTGFGDDISPELALGDVPAAAASIAIIMDDLDVPFAKEFTHWILWNISPLITQIPQGLPGGAEIISPIRAVQGNAWGRHVYRGPKQPPFIRKPHRYRFTVYALDIMLEISADSNKKRLLSEISGHVIEKAELVGIYDPRVRG